MKKNENDHCYPNIFLYSLILPATRSKKPHVVISHSHEVSSKLSAKRRILSIQVNLSSIYLGWLDIVRKVLVLKSSVLIMFTWIHRHLKRKQTHYLQLKSYRGHHPQSLSFSCIFLFLFSLSVLFPNGQKDIYHQQPHNILFVNQLNNNKKW